MLDPVKVERAESEIDRFIASRADSRKAANEEAAAWARADRARLEETRTQNRTLWREHYRRMVVVHIKMALDYRRKLRELAK